jgi:hypothetical protein
MLPTFFRSRNRPSQELLPQQKGSRLFYSVLILIRDLQRNIIEARKPPDQLITETALGETLHKEEEVGARNPSPMN